MIQTHSQHEFDSQREWLQVTLSSIADAVITTDVPGVVTFLNPVAEKLTGWSSADAVGRTIEDIFVIVNEDTRERVTNPIAKVLELGTTQGLAGHAILISRGGKEYAIEDSAAPIRLANGELLGVVVVFHDISHRRVLEKQLHERADALTERDRRKDEFLAMLAHELRNPLAPISNALYIVKSETLDAGIRKEAVSLAERQLRHMTRLLDDLLDVSRITLGKIQLKPEKIQLKDIIHTAIDANRPLMDERSHTFDIALPPKPVWINGDTTRLSQVFSNLLNNAAKYTPPGGHIGLVAYEDVTGLTVKIKDNGIGIPKDMLPHIFDLFAQVDNSMERSAGGLGIGLTLVKSLIEMHAGTVKVFSDDGSKGTEFVIHLPTEALAGADPAQKPLPVHEGSPAGYKILVVDDNEASAATLGWTLEILGHEVLVVHSAKEAIDQAAIFAPEIILLDIGLPITNGYEICAKLRKKAMFRDTVFIAQTGWGQQEHLKRSQAAGFDHHMVKPVRMEELKTIIDKLVIKPRTSPLRNDTHSGPTIAHRPDLIADV